MAGYPHHRPTSKVPARRLLCFPVSTRPADGNGSIRIACGRYWMGQVKGHSDAVLGRQMPAASKSGTLAQSGQGRAPSGLTRSGPPPSRMRARTGGASLATASRTRLW